MHTCMLINYGKKAGKVNIASPPVSYPSFIMVFPRIKAVRAYVVSSVIPLPLSSRLVFMSISPIPCVLFFFLFLFIFSFAIKSNIWKRAIKALIATM